MKNGRRTLAERGDSEPAVPSPEPAEGGSTAVAKKSPGGVVTENDDLVSYLQQTGSILALASLLDQAEEVDEAVDFPNGDGSPIEV